jgi:hypothetical protein
MKLKTIKLKDATLLRFDPSSPELVMKATISGKYHSIALTIDIWDRREITIRTLMKKAYDWKTKSLITFNYQDYDILPLNK